MPRLALSKSSMSKESAKLKTYERFLPSLDMKRKQLIAERAKASRALLTGEAEFDAILERVGEELPMLAMPLSNLEGMARITEVRVGVENIVGTELPRLDGVGIDVHRFPLLGKPHWIDALEQQLRNALELSIEIQVLQQRLDLLNDAVRTITQRVNLFEKVLIPRTRHNIKTIGIFLADAERAAVVRAKISKNKRAAAS